jgi:hypothetical protein
MDQVDATSQEIGMSADCQRVLTRRLGPNRRDSIKANKSEFRAAAQTAAMGQEQPLAIVSPGRLVSARTSRSSF